MWLTQLQENGYRLTEARRTVVEIMQRSTHALTPVEIFQSARKKYRAIGLVSVYRTLETLEEFTLSSAYTSHRGARYSSPNARDMSIYCFVKSAVRLPSL
jgi:Fe2+ or Zn2+ uptake regulation protein